LNSFVERAQQNDPALFPSIGGNASLRALAIRRSIEEFGKIKLTNTKLKQLVDKTMRKFDACRPQGAKKPKSTKQSDVASGEFQICKPYLDLKYPQQHDGPLNAPTNSLLNAYWKIHDARINEKLAGGRSFWK